MNHKNAAVFLAVIALVCTITSFICWRLAIHQGDLSIDALAGARCGNRHCVSLKERGQFVDARSHEATVLSAVAIASALGGGVAGVAALGAVVISYKRRQGDGMGA